MVLDEFECNRVEHKARTGDERGGKGGLKALKHMLAKHIVDFFSRSL
jgi:hypothetical protein